MDAPPTPPAAEPRVPRPGPLPGSPAVDAALAVTVLLAALMEVIAARGDGVATVPSLLPGPAGAVVGTLLATAQAALVLLRRRRPRRAFALLAVVAVGQYAAVGVPGTYVWAVLAHAVGRAPGRAAGWLLVPWLGSLAGYALVGLQTIGDPGTAAGAAVGGGAVLGVFVLAGGVAGRYTRATARQAERERREAERVRRSAALRTERARIAEEIGRGVLTGLHRLVDRTRCYGPAAPEDASHRTPPSETELRELREQARSVLAAMRRVLGVLRTPDDPDAPPRATAPPDPAGDRRRFALPLPDRAGLVATAALLVVALPLAALPYPTVGDPAVDRVFDTFDLPLGSAPGLLVVACQFALVAWWRTAPVPAVLLAGVGTVLAAALGATNAIADGSWLLLVWGASTQARPRWSGPAISVSTLTWLAGALVFGYPQNTVGGAGFLALACLGALPLWIAGILLRRHRRDDERRHRDLAEAGNRDAVARERLRIARDLHDVVAHHVSAIAVQAGAARMATDPDDRAAALAHIDDSGRRVAAALPELAGLTPEPDGVVLDDAGVGRLLAGSRTAGLPVTVDVVGTPAEPPGDAELFAQRILTEALTNVLRHAGPAPTRVRVEHRPSEVSVEIVDDGPAPGHRPDGHGSGLGLVGMHERVALLGGGLHAGPDGGPGWTVRAVLPRAPLVRADEAVPAPISSSAPIHDRRPQP
ncbi:histidine kinase [Pseudonocardia nantongensis]|uniref:ATP-binding protein n=1 Tax=Pseudonocardia nantongensis TaxID=1181885 RepID=UPI0039787A91